MEKDDKGSRMIRMGVSGWMSLLVPAYPGCPGSKAVKRSLLLLSLPALFLPFPSLFFPADIRASMRVKKLEWWGAGVVICLERGADLHTAQLMQLPLTVSCFSKTQIGFTFLVPSHLGSPGQRAIKWVCTFAFNGCTDVVIWTTFSAHPIVPIIIRWMTAVVLYIIIIITSSSHTTIISFVTKWILTYSQSYWHQ